MHFPIYFVILGCTVSQQRAVGHHNLYSMFVSGSMTVVRGHITYLNATMIARHGLLHNVCAAHEVMHADHVSQTHAKLLVALDLFVHLFTLAPPNSHFNRTRARYHC